jgi:hypothetical protein
MKKLFITAAIATMFSVTAFADGGKKTTTGTSEANVSHVVLNQFNVDFTDAANVAWALTPNCQKVDFTVSDVKYTAFYSLSGDYLGLTQNVDYKVLPASTQKEIAEKYKGYAVSEVIKYQTQKTDEPLVYFVDVKKADSEIVLKVTPNQNVAFFQQVK